MQRRQLFRHAGAWGLGSAFGHWAQAQNAAPPAALDDYKALVCVFLLGGNDGNNMVVPLDERHGDYTRLRGSALALPADRLLPLPDAHGRASFGLNPALAAIAPLWASGRLALQFNTGPLIEPLTRNDYQRAGRKPDNLFSHSDQQDWAQSLEDGIAVRTGWGYRLASFDSRGKHSDGPGAARLPALISLAGNPRFVQGEVRSSLVLPARGNFGLSGNVADAPGAARMQALRALWAQNGTPIGRQAGDILTAALDAAGFVNPLINPAPAATLTPAAQPFVDLKTDISQQLLRVARLIEARAAVGNRRQLFFVALGGFDTHTNQRADQDRLLGELGAALKAFHDATDSLGLAEQVTSFTMSDFSRTFKPNNSGGTDHAWGNHHLVLGGAVRGGQTYGRYPTLALGGPDDAAREGRWIPSTAYDQYVATLARWFGADAAALQAITPHLARFDQADLGFMA